jgi:hypothetical protein
MQQYTFIFWVHGSCGPDRYLMQSEAKNDSDAKKRGKAFASANRIRFIEATTEAVEASPNDATDIRPFPNL